MPYTIYKISNDLNDKVYIGSTRELLAKRWSCHKSYAKHNYGDSELYQEMRRLGIDHFNCVPIATCDTLAGSIEAENRLIKEYDSIASGYNTNLPAVPENVEPAVIIVEDNHRVLELKAVLVSLSLVALWKAFTI